MKHIMDKLILLLFYYLTSYGMAFMINRKHRSDSDIFHVATYQWRTILINGFILAIALGLADV